MTIFTVAAKSPRPDIAQRIEREFPGQWYQVFQGNLCFWLISATEITTKGILDKLDMTSGGDGHVLITALSGYSGWHQPDIWEWIKTRKTP